MALAAARAAIASGRGVTRGDQQWPGADRGGHSGESQPEGCGGMTTDVLGRDEAPRPCAARGLAKARVAAMARSCSAGWTTQIAAIM